VSVSGINGTADGDTRTTLEGRPTDEEVRINLTLRPEQFTIKYRRDRDLAHEGPAFNHAVALARKDHPGFLESTYRPSRR
jgi:hypothetical protein